MQRGDPAKLEEPRLSPLFTMMASNPAIYCLPVEIWEEIIALVAYDASPFAPIDQCSYIHSRRARKLLRLGQEFFRKRLSKLSCVCKSWYESTERLKHQSLEVVTNDRLGGHGSARPARQPVTCPALLINIDSG